MPFHGPLNDLHSEEEAPVPANYPGDAADHEPELYRKFRQHYLEKGFEGHDLKTRAGWQRLNRNYAGLCSQVDDALSRILWTLEASGQSDNTVVIFTSDHGEMMGSHTLVGKSVFYEEATRVPLLIRAPFLQRRQIVVDRPAVPSTLFRLCSTCSAQKPWTNCPDRALFRDAVLRLRKQLDRWQERTGDTIQFSGKEI